MTPTLPDLDAACLALVQRADMSRAQMVALCTWEETFPTPGAFHAALSRRLAAAKRSAQGGTDAA